MRNLLALSAAAVIAFLVVGYFQEWYKFTRTPTGSGTKLELDVNSPKITEDINKAKEKARTWLSQGTSGNAPAPQVIRTTPPELPNGTPTTFKLTDDGTLVFPSIPAPPPINTTPPGLPQR